MKNRIPAVRQIRTTSGISSREGPAVRSAENNTYHNPDQSDYCQTGHCDIHYSLANERMIKAHMRRNFSTICFDDFSSQKQNPLSPGSPRFLETHKTSTKLVIQRDYARS